MSLIKLFLKECGCKHTDQVFDEPEDLQESTEETVEDCGYTKKVKKETSMTGTAVGGFEYNEPLKEKKK